MKKIKIILISLLISAFIFFVFETFFRAYFNEFNNRIVEGYENHGVVQNKYQFFKTIKSKNGETRIRDPKYIDLIKTFPNNNILNTIDNSKMYMLYIDCYNDIPYDNDIVLDGASEMFLYKNYNHRIYF
jgi:hypothetical protein